MINAYIELLQEEGLVETREERSKRRQDHMNNVEDRETNVHSKLGNEEVTKIQVMEEENNEENETQNENRQDKVHKMISNLLISF